jgi:hypothetical protein
VDDGGRLLQLATARRPAADSRAATSSGGALGSSCCVQLGDEPEDASKQQERGGDAHGPRAVAPGAAGSAAAANAGAALRGLVDDYSAAYAVMKGELEVRLRHEAARADFFHGRSGLLEGELREARAVLEATQG